MSDTPIIISIVAFQTFIILALGLLNITYGIDGEQNISTVNTGVETFDLNFGANLLNNISALGIYNVLIFSPITIAIGYIIAKLIRGGG